MNNTKDSLISNKLHDWNFSYKQRTLPPPNYYLIYDSWQSLAFFGRFAFHVYPPEQEPIPVKVIDNYIWSY